VLTVDLGRAAVVPGMRVLDVGCGGGRHTFACLKAGAHVVSLDAQRSEIDTVGAMVGAMHAAGEVPPGTRDGGVVADLTCLPFAESSFDRVIASEVLEHVVDDEAAIAEVARVLRPGGLAALSVPAAGPERANWALSAAYHEVEGGHVRIYAKRELVGRLARYGLVVVASHRAHALHSPYWLLRCAVGVDRESHPLVAAYHRLLVWDITRRPFVTRAVERVLNPLIGKSLVLYAEKAA
jgi:SAM-dependent methyltransferase